MKFVIDMNLPPSWCGELSIAGFDAVHWSKIGPGTATDAEIMEWARSTGRTVITHDLDFPALLAATQERSPSVVLVRGPDPTRVELVARAVTAIAKHRAALEVGAILVVEADTARARLLPLVRR